MYEIGKHPARSVGGALGMSSRNNEQIAIEFEFVDGANKGKRITHYGSFTPDAEQYTFEAMRVAGFQGDDLSDLSSLARADTPIVQLVLQNEEWNGQQQVRVRFVNKLGGAALKNPLGDDQKKSFAERMKARLQAHDRSATTPPVRRAALPQAPSPSTRPDDDVPF